MRPCKHRLPALLLAGVVFLACLAAGHAARLDDAAEAPESGSKI